ncbi:hypothetical protein [Actinomadura sp. NTSP31]|uniref:hypothetical protein n=1 Tax=Actinomadura sp. NTSP31 TaxID=1735447 RepID=UPI0035BF4606
MSGRPPFVTSHSRRKNALRFGVVQEGALGDDDRIIEEPWISLEHVHIRVAEKREQRPVDRTVDLDAVLAVPGHDLAEFPAPPLFQQEPPQLFELR